MGKVLESVGLGLKDIEIKYVPFQAMGAALQNGALDAALEVPPYTERSSPRGIATRVDRSLPSCGRSPTITVAYMVNTDWAAQNKAAAHRVMLPSPAPAANIATPITTAPTARQAIDGS